MTLEYWRRSTLSALRTRTGNWAGLRAQPNLLGWAAIALAVALAAPFFLVDMPPVLDYPNHLARFMVLAHPGDRALSAMYAPHWVLLPNLGADILGMLLLNLKFAPGPPPSSGEFLNRHMGTEEAAQLPPPSGPSPTPSRPV